MMFTATDSIDGMKGELDQLESEAKDVLNSRLLTRHGKRVEIAKLLKRYTRTHRRLTALLREYRARTERRMMTRAAAANVVMDLLTGPEFRMLTLFALALVTFCASARETLYPVLEVPGFPGLLDPEAAPTPTEDNEDEAGGAGFFAPPMGRR